MRLTTYLLYLCLVVAPWVTLAQIFPTNHIRQAQAVNLATQLRVDMREEDVVKFLEEKHRLKPGSRVGTAGEWVRFYVLADGCHLELRIGPKGMINDKWENGLLRSASIQSNGQKIISITLTNKLQLSGPVDGSQPFGSVTNRTSPAAGSRH
jgi:hypothetical protein